MLVTVSLYAQRKLDFLDINAKRKFLGIIYKFIQHQLAAKQARILIGQSKNKKLIRLRYNLDYRIVASLLRTETETQLRILDFVSHQEMDQGRYFTDLNAEYETVDFKELPTISENSPAVSRELVEKIQQASLWNEKASLNKIIQDHPKEKDFYIYCLSNDENEEIADLSLSPEQYQLVKQELPLFLAGSAGSGKTTIALYHAIQKAIQIQKYQLNQTIAYITYSPYLKKYAERIIQEIYSLESLPQLQLFDYNSLCRHLGIDSKQFPLQKQVTQQRFINNFFQTRTNQQKRKIDPVALWQEIRHLIKGSVEATESERKLISKDAYREHTNNFQDNWEAVYALAENYQNWLEQQQYWDEIDLTQTLLKLRQSDQYQYDFLYCDEVQDLTEIQIHFLLTLLRPPHNPEFPQFLFTGDTAQIINPSGFSWNKVKTVLHKNYEYHSQWIKIKEFLDSPKNLSFNFRSTRSIVDFNNQILNLKKDKSESQLPFRGEGIKPVIISNIPEEEFLKNRTIFGPRNAIITVNEEDKEKLVKQFSQDNIKSERILTISEVKGLEFDEVLVWNFFSRFDSWVSRTRGQLKELEQFKYNCLYVCGTRSRNHLYFYEETDHSFWEKAELANYIEHSNTKIAANNFFTVNTTPEDWWNSAQELEEQGAYKQARENYLRGGWEKDAQRVKALDEEAEGNYQKAAEIWLKLGQIESAIEALKEIEDYSQIAKIWYEQGNLQESAIAWKKAEDYEKAAKIYQEIPDWEEAATCWRKLERWEKVAALLEKQHKWLDAAQLWEEAGEIIKAATSCQNGEHWREAISYWETINEMTQVALMYQRCAGETWEQLGKKEEAAQAYEYGKYWHKAEQFWQELENWYRLAIVYEKQEKWQDAAETWFWKLKEIEAAANAYEKAECYFEAEQCYRNLEAWEKVAEACEKQEKWQEAGEVWQSLKQWEKAGDAFQENESWEVAAECYEKAENWQQAENCWDNTNNKERSAIACEKQNQPDKLYKAAYLWQELLVWERAATVWEQIKETTNAAECYEKAENWQNAERCWLNFGNWQKVALCREKQAKWKAAGDAWQEVDIIQNAAECYEKGKIWHQAESCWRLLENWQKVAETCENQRKYLEAAPMWERVPNFRQAGECYETVAHWESAERCWREVRDKRRIALACDKQGKWRESAPLWEELKEWKAAAIAYQNFGHLETAAELFERAGCLTQARECWKLLQQWDRVAPIYEKQERYFDAGRSWEQVPNLTRAAKNYKESFAWSDAERCWRQLERWEEVAKACEGQNQKQKYQQAAEIWKYLAEQENRQEFYKKAASAYEKAHNGKAAAKIWLYQLGNRRRAIWALGQHDVKDIL